MAHHGDAKQLAEYHAKYPQCYDEPAKNLGAAYLELAAEVEALRLALGALIDKDNGMPFDPCVRKYGFASGHAITNARAAMKAPA